MWPQVFSVNTLKQSTRLIGLFGIAVSILTSPVISVAEKQPTQAKVGSSPTIQAALQLKISLSRRQATLFQGSKPIKSYQIGVGRPGWKTPTGTFRVAQKQKNPTWISPFNNQVIPGGDPRNPMGRYWIGFWNNGKNWIGFHGTLDPSSVGKAASHGCIHMHSQDLEDLFSRVPLGTIVTIVP